MIDMLLVLGMALLTGWLFGWLIGWLRGYSKGSEDAAARIAGDIRKRTLPRKKE